MRWVLDRPVKPGDDSQFEALILSMRPKFAILWTCQFSRSPKDKDAAGRDNGALQVRYHRDRRAVTVARCRVSGDRRTSYAPVSSCRRACSRLQEAVEFCRIFGED